MVFPIDKESKPYEMTIKVRPNESNLKQVFTEDYFYWREVFKGHSPIEPPNYYTFRKEIGEKDGEQVSKSLTLALQCLLLKCDGHKFP